MSDKLKPGMLTYDEPQKATIYIGGRKIGQGTVKMVSHDTDETRDYTKPGEWSPNPMSISGTVKVSKKDARLFRQQYMKKARLPRKLKKAMRHVAVFNAMPQIDPSCIKPESKDVVINMEYYYGVKGNYPRTKWVIKAFKVIRHHVQLCHQMMQERMLAESLPNRGPEMVVNKEDIAKITPFTAKPIKPGDPCPAINVEGMNEKLHNEKWKRAYENWDYPYKPKFDFFMEIIKIAERDNHNILEDIEDSRGFAYFSGAQSVANYYFDRLSCLLYYAQVNNIEHPYAHVMQTDKDWEWKINNLHEKK